MDKLTSLLTRENITLSLAIFGSASSVFTWLYSFVVNRKNIQFHIIGQRYSDSESLLLYMSFINKSRLPISITAISVKDNNALYSCQEIPITTLEETTRCGNKVISHHEYKSMPLPITISGLSGTSGYVYFEFPEAKPQLDATRLTFRVSTNRGKAVEKTLSLGRHLD